MPVTILDDQVVEGDEIFEAFLVESGSLTRGVVFSSESTIITILENDCKSVYAHNTLHNSVEPSYSIHLILLSTS